MIYGRRYICSFSTPLLCALCVCVELTLEYYAFTICCGVYHKIESQWSTECDDVVVVVVVQNSKYYNQSSFRSDKFASCSWRERFDSRKLFILIYLAFRSEMLLLPTLLQHSSSIRQSHVLYLCAISVTGCFYLFHSRPLFVCLVCAGKVS